MNAHLPSPRRLKNEAESQFPNMKHLVALDKVAKDRGWSSYKAYLRAYKASQSPTLGYAVTLSARWFDRTTHAHGSMNASVMLSEPWANFLPLADRRNVGTLGAFHIHRADRTRLIAPTAYASELSCLHNLSKAARRLVFTDVMRVLPASIARTTQAFRGDPHRMLTSRYPNQDHDSLWHDPKTGLHFILNEPYQVDLEKQEAVFSSRGMVAFTSRLWTMHNPAGTLAQLIAPQQDQDLLKSLFQRSQTLVGRFQKVIFSDTDGYPLDILT